MIKIKIYRGGDGIVRGFDADSHGDKIVCAAVSALVLNSVNCVEHFTDAKFECDYNEKGGKLHFKLTSEMGEEPPPDALLLIEAMVFGLYGIREQYGDSLNINEVTI